MKNTSAGQTVALDAKQAQFVKEYLDSGNVSIAAGAIGLNLTTTPPLEGHYVYILVDDATDRLLYVGKGKGKRMFMHVPQVRKGLVSGSRKFAGLRAILDNGGSVTPFVVFAGIERDALQIERMMIVRLADADLLNTAMANSPSPDLSCKIKATDYLAFFRRRMERPFANERDEDICRRCVDACASIIDHFDRKGVV